jgi:lipoate-protein ligase A
MNWRVIDSGRQSARQNMAEDEILLEALLTGTEENPTLRFFQWTEPSVTYGFLLKPHDVKTYFPGNPPMVRRPTGGGAVLHTHNDLGVSLAWPRGQGILPETPRECYAEIHLALKEGLASYLNEKSLDLFVRPPGSCEQKPPADGANPRLCFQNPVCNDIMIGRQKVVGGALRIKRKAILYQGTIQWSGSINMEQLKKHLITAMIKNIFAENAMLAS